MKRETELKRRKKEIEKEWRQALRQLREGTWTGGNIFDDPHLAALNEEMYEIKREETAALLAAMRDGAIGKIKVVSRDTSIERKELARLVRQLFKKLGLKNISVTSPNYANVQSIDVEFPSYIDGTMEMNQTVKEWLNEILVRAFPAHWLEYQEQITIEDPWADWGTLPPWIIRSR